MKKIMLTTFLGILMSQNIMAQKYFTRTGTTHFKASVATFEPVEATNKSTTAILKTETGDVAAQLFVSAFQFKVALMQEHFNENYMDSDTYPKAIFRGKLQDFSMKNLSEEKEFLLKGTLTIKGKAKKINTKAKVYAQNDKIYLQTTFNVKPQDFDIEIPSIVRKKIAKEIKITVDYELVEKK